MLVRHVDGNIYLTTKTVAIEFGVASPTVSNWRKRGLLTPAHVTKAGRPLYRLQDVARAEKLVRDRMHQRRTYLAQLAGERVEDVVWPAPVP